MRCPHVLLFLFLFLLLLLLLANASHAVGASLWLYNVHSKEELHVVAMEPTGMMGRTWRRANHFFRSWRTQQRRTVHPRLLRTLAHIQSHFGKRRIEIISGYRTPAVGNELNSYHQVGRAADVRIVGVPKAELFAYCRTLKRMGCGYYPKAEFVHVDVRGTSAIWVDRSPPGQKRDYAADPRRWLRLHGL